MPLAQQATPIVTDPRGYITALIGPAGIGKTSFGAQIDGHYFFKTPNAGTEGVEVVGDPILSWSDFIEKATELLEAKKDNFKEQREVKMCIVDVITDLFDYAGIEVCKTQKFMEKGVAKKYDKIEEVPFGAGYKAACKLLLRNLGVLHLNGFGILLTSHVKERVIKWAGSDHQHYGFNLSPSVALTIEAACGAIGQLVMEETIERNDEGTIIKAETGRWMYFQPTFLRTAKHRLEGFPAKLPFKINEGWSTYCKAFTETVEKRKAKRNSEPLER